MLRAIALFTLLVIAGNAHANLFAAVHADDARWVESLLAAGAAVDQRDTYGQTPLMYALDEGASNTVVSALLEAGADPNARTAAGWIPSMYAIRNGNIWNLLTLVRAGGSLEGGPANVDPASLSPNALVTAVAVATYFGWLASLLAAFLAYLTARSRRVGRWIARLSAGPVHDVHEWRDVSMWGRERSRVLWARLACSQPLVAVVAYFAVHNGVSSLLGADVHQPAWATTAVAFSSLWAVGAFFVVTYRRLREHEPYMRKSVPRALRPLGPVIRALENGWFYRFEELVTVSGGEIRAVILSHADTQPSWVRLLPSMVTADLGKENGIVDDPSLAQLLATETPNYILTGGTPVTVRTVVYAPNATSSEFNDRLSVRGGWVFGGDPAGLAEQIEAWQETDAYELLEERKARERAEYGRQVEAEALAEAKAKLPSAWRIVANYMLPSGGDADLVIFLPSQHRFVIDVKSHRGDPTNPGSDKDWLGVLEQMRRQAHDLKAQPIVWQPLSDRERVVRLEEVAFVAGSADELRSFLEERAGLRSAAD